jgi:hypothetical protein
MARQRERSAETRPLRVVTPETRSRWNRAHRFSRFGLTEDQYNQMLEEQGHACAVCREPFRDDQRICIDHDHTCCPVGEFSHTRSCGECVRGLLCVRCNTWLGWLEKYGSAVGAYLAGGGGHYLPQDTRRLVPAARKLVW